MISIFVGLRQHYLSDHLTGPKAASDTLVTMVRTPEGLSLLLVDKDAPGVSVRRIEGFMASACEVNFESTSVPATSLIGTAGQGWEILERTALKALPVLILGGFESVPGAIVGGLIIGASEKLAEVYLGPFVGGGIHRLCIFCLLLGTVL